MEEEIMSKDGELDSFREFRKRILKVREPRSHKIRNSLGTYDAYKWIRKNKWIGIGKPITEHIFYSVIRKINNILVEDFLNGDDIILPYKLGKIELRKYDAYITLNKGKVITNLPIDWDRTLKLWSEDEEAYKERTLVKMEEKEIYRIYYNKKRANYNNKSFYTFEVNRKLKREIKKRIKEGHIDAFKI